MQIVFSDSFERETLHPLTLNKPASKLRLGILTLGEKWEQALNARGSDFCPDYLQPAFPLQLKGVQIILDPRILPSEELINAIHYLDADTALVQDEHFIAARVDEQIALQVLKGDLTACDLIEFENELTNVSHPWDLFKLNPKQIIKDYQLLTKNRTSAAISEDVFVKGDQLFVEEGAELINCSLNTSEGPIYIGKNAKILEGSLIRGPFALCESAQVNMGAKIVGGTTVGPWSKVGGEINNSIISGYSNKAHDGFMGNSVIGEWCNLGADTNTSNLKNNYGMVKVYDYSQKKAIDSGQQFCGLIMGDHSKCGINTMFNTGTVVGLMANIFDAGFPPKFIPSYSWGGKDGFERFKLNKALEVAETVMKRRSKTLSDTERQLYTDLFEMRSNDII